MKDIDYISRLVDRYVDARGVVIDEGFDSELDWQQSVNFEYCQESDFLRETAWVILSSGMKESVIRKKFPDISISFLDFHCSKSIMQNADSCRCNAKKIFNHAGKIDAIINAAYKISTTGFNSVKDSTRIYGSRYLESFNFIGPITSQHLAKNLGLNVSKPDRHLCRIAASLGFFSVKDLCETVSEETGDSVPVVDLVFWRFATLRNDYLDWFQTNKRSRTN